MQPSNHILRSTSINRSNFNNQIDADYARCCRIYFSTSTLTVQHFSQSGHPPERSGKSWDSPPRLLPHQGRPSGIAPDTACRTAGDRRNITTSRDSDRHITYVMIGCHGLIRTRKHDIGCCSNVVAAAKGGRGNKVNKN